jgi:flagellar biosynthetic protein FlhB
MSEAADKESKTEPASEKKKRDSIEKGQIPSSKEALLFASLLGILVGAVLTVSDGAMRLTTTLRGLVEHSGEFSFGNSADAMLMIESISIEIGRFLLPLILVCTVATVAASVLQNPPRIVLDRIMPKFSRVSLSGGAQRIFGRQARTEFAKALFKFAAIAVVVAVLLGSDYNALTNAMFGDPSALPEMIRVLSVRLLAGVGVATIVLVGADLVWSRMHWEHELRMTRQEVKDEHKQAEGDPIQKARRLSLARARSRRRMMAAVPTATVVVANPTHFAVAMRYRRDEDAAPVVVAKGMDLVALKIREIAEANDVPVVEDKALARSLHDAVEIDRMIPPEFYRAVAELLHFLQGKKTPLRSRY